MISIIFMVLFMLVVITDVIVNLRNNKTNKETIKSNNEILEAMELSNRLVETNTRARIEHNNHIKELIVVQRACNKRVKDNNKLLRSIKR